MTDPTWINDRERQSEFEQKEMLGPSWIDIALMLIVAILITAYGCNL
jgi:hypothetical protein